MLPFLKDVGGEAMRSKYRMPGPYLLTEVLLERIKYGLYSRGLQCFQGKFRFHLVKVGKEGANIEELTKDFLGAHWKCLGRYEEVRLGGFRIEMRI